MATDIDGSCNDATCGSPTVISCTEPCLQEGGQDGSAVLCHTLTEKSDDKKDPAASADASQSSKECSVKNIEPTLSSEEANIAGDADDRSFSFEVGDPPKVSEKAHSPAWSPFPRSKAAQSTKVSLSLFSCSVCTSLKLKCHTIGLHELAQILAWFIIS